RHRGRAWTQEVEAAAAGFWARLKAIEAREKLRHPPDAEFIAICSGVEHLLGKAEKAARGQCPRHYPFLSWWRGTNIEAAFQNIHQAESELVRLYSDDEVDAEIPEAVARAETGLNRDHPMREVARRLSQMRAGNAKRTTLSKIIKMGHESADRSHSRIRNFRNVLLSTALLIAILLLAFSWVVYHAPGNVPLCFEPTTPPITVACPTGDGPGQTPAPFDIVVVIMLGLLGGSLAAAVSIRNLRGTSTPYDIPIALALLKVPAGALTALGALIAIRGQFIPGLSALDTQEQILAYALIFGYAQQLLTGLIDRRAFTLLDTVPSKDPEQSPLPSTTHPAATRNGQPASGAITT
ncbi:MAG: hypothetical protein ACRDTG_07815, partial [Pseudonocardiaceae bacterium]